MLFIGSGSGEATDEHDGYVSGRYRDGALSDIWTDVTRCAERTFTAYVPACERGWRGSAKPADATGFHSAQHEWLERHFLQLDDACRAVPYDRSQFIGWSASSRSG
jgi:hypothetical protein